MILFLLLVLVCGSMWAWGKIYSDNSNGYSGYASAVFNGSRWGGSSMEKVRDKLFDDYKKLGPGMQEYFRIENITNEESWLAWSALNEYNYNDGEIYFVTVVAYPKGKKSRNIILFVEICNNGRSFNYYAYVGQY